MIEWRTAYTNERWFNSNDTEWSNLPPKGVLGVVLYKEPPYRKIVTGGDWYYWDDETITCTGSTWNGWVDAPKDADDPKRGAAVPDSEWENVRSDLLEARTCP